MKAVGVRELKNRLSEYLRLVRNGETVLVTDRGAVIAELGPPGESRLQGASPLLDELMRRGNVTIGAPNDPDLYSAQTPVAKPGLAAELLDAERADR
jgi:antitoxin (DNA-binding transcriptional repressor) of toxin-antitoxin stability system